MNYQITVTGPGIDSRFIVSDVDDLTFAQRLLEKIARELARTTPDAAQGEPK